jgi:hypothetical protein
MKPAASSFRRRQRARAQAKAEVKEFFERAHKTARELGKGRVPDKDVQQAIEEWCRFQWIRPGILIEKGPVILKDGATCAARRLSGGAVCADR